MILHICYFLIYVCEAFISFFYFGSKFNTKVKPILLFSTYAGFGLLAFVASRIDNIPLLNAFIYIISNYIILTFCYSTSFKSRVYNTLALTVTMIVTETIVMNFLSLFFDTTLYNISNNTIYLITLSTLSKLLFFIAVYLYSKFINKENKTEKSFLPLFLCVLPVSSVIWMVSTYYLSLTSNFDGIIKTIFSLCNVFILFSNIVVFYVYERTIKTNKLYTELLLTKQKEKNSESYYELLRTQNDNSKILIHDITKHLNSILMLSTDSNTDIHSYVKNIIEDFTIMNPIDYCSNSLLNLIVYRYSTVCKKEQIVFDINIQSCDLSFMAEPDITALFDNILENAIESTRKANDKTITFTIDIRNTNFLVIKVTNPCVVKPKLINGNIITSKKDTSLHGIGLKSIKRVVKKYDGNIHMSYEENERNFTTTITFQIIDD